MFAESRQVLDGLKDAKEKLVLVMQFIYLIYHGFVLEYDIIQYT